VTIDRLLHSRLAVRLVGWVFQYMSFSIPVSRLYETPALVAFYHPHPAYPVHILIVPKRAYATLMDVPLEDQVFLTDLIQTVQRLVKQLELEAQGYRLITNGGRFQDFPQLHFHLISGEAYDRPPFTPD
jgi:histidine triad (HIT) family protein